MNLAFPSRAWERERKLRPTRSYNKLKGYFKFGSANTVINYIDYLQDSYLLFLVNAFSPAYKKQVNSSKKVYAICNSFVNKIGFHLSNNVGVLLENLTFLYLRQNYQHIFYYRTHNHLEVDFLAYNTPHKPLLIQVTQTLSDPKVRERELRALDVALDELKRNKGLILTASETETIEVNGKTITVKPLYVWLLGL